MSTLNRRSALLGGLALASLPLARAEDAASPMARPVPMAPPPARRIGQQPAEHIDDPRVESFLLHSSRHGGEPWRIHYARPSAPAPAAGYPVLYLIDGNATFPLMWHAAQALQALHPALDAGSIAVVGVGYPADVRFDTARRFHDLTPYTAAEYRSARGADILTGGQDQFLDFIADDVRDAIASRIPIDAGRQGLFGHSLGGLFTLHALYTRPALFQTYIAADPSIWWNGGSILAEQAGFEAGIQAAGGRLASPIRLLVENSGGKRPASTATPTPERSGQASMAAIAASAPAAAPAAPVHGPARDASVALNSAQALARISGLTVGYRRFDNESHPSMLQPATLDALSFFLGRTPDAVRQL